MSRMSPRSRGRATSRFAPKGAGSACVTSVLQQRSHFREAQSDRLLSPLWLQYMICSRRDLSAFPEEKGGLS